MTVVKSRADGQMRYEQKCVNVSDNCCPLVLNTPTCNGDCADGLQICYVCCNNNDCNRDLIRISKY